MRKKKKTYKNRDTAPCIIKEDCSTPEMNYKEVFTLPIATDDISFRNGLIPKTLSFKKWLNQLIITDSDFYFYEFQSSIAENIYIICMITAYIEKRSTDIKEFSDCLNDYRILRQLVQTIENYYDIHISSNPRCNNEEAEGKSNLFYPILKSVKVELLGTDADHSFALTRELRTVIHAFIAELPQDSSADYSKQNALCEEYSILHDMFICASRYLHEHTEVGDISEKTFRAQHDSVRQLYGDYCYRLDAYSKQHFGLNIEELYKKFITNNL